MAGLAQILKESGHQVSGADIQFYPPMSEYIEDIGIKTIQGYKRETLPDADLYVIGNALSEETSVLKKFLIRIFPLFLDLKY